MLVETPIELGSIQVNQDQKAQQAFEEDRK
jgi:hypothetical protein